MSHSTFYTLGQAAKAAGKAKGTIKNAIDKGRLSASKNEKGEYAIDPAELDRVYSTLSTKQDKMNEVLPPHSTGISHTEKDALEAQIKMLEKVVDDLRGDRDEWRKQAQTLALTDQRQKGGFWSLFRKSG